MLKSILFPILDEVPAGAALDTACALANLHDASLTFGICVNAVPTGAVASSIYPLQLYESFGLAASQHEARLRERLEDELDDRDVRYRIQSASSQVMGPADLAAMLARYFDLVIFGRSAAGNVRLERDQFATLLFESGRPILVAPANASPAPMDNPALVAWKPTREAARAVHDALPLLARAARVRVLSVNARSGALDHGELIGADIGAELAAHELQVETVTRPKEAGGTGATLLQDAAEQGAGLLVAGGYGHRRVREFLFSGTTQDLFDDATIPVLFSH
jgi:nucleotide-binding universal stress UspA family protein